MSNKHRLFTGATHSIHRHDTKKKMCVHGHKKLTLAFNKVIHHNKVKNEYDKINCLKIENIDLFIRVYIA